MQFAINMFVFSPLFSHYRNFSSWHSGGDQHSIQCPSSRHHIHSVYRWDNDQLWPAVRSAARGHHLRLPGTHTYRQTDRLAYAQRSAYSFWKYKWLMRWLCWLLFVHAFCFLCTLSNTRLFFRTTRGQASWSEMEQGSERDALWQESSWRTTLREGRKHYGKREREEGIVKPVWKLNKCFIGFQ